MVRGLGAHAAALAWVARAVSHRQALSRPITLRRAVSVHLASERMLPIIAAVVVLAASVVSFQPAAAANPIGGVDGAGTAPRIAVGGEIADQLDPAEARLATGANSAKSGPADGVQLPAQTYADDGTVYKPVAVNTTVEDGKALLEIYTVESGDTLTGIAGRHGISMMTIWWANKLTAKDELHVGQKLVIPPVDGLVVIVKEGDSLDSLAARYKVDAADILAVNQLEDPNLIIGQTLILPDAAGAPIPTPKPRPGSSGGSRSGSSCNCSGPSTYGGAAFAWPVVGGGNYLSQRFHYGHYGDDIAADYGSRVIAVGAGTVTFAGWKNNGGGYQVWIAHGSGLNTTYNHMSSVSVSAGESVSRGEAIGRVGQSGWATGPHLHFEVWIGPIWNGGYRVNPLRYY